MDKSQHKLSYKQEIILVKQVIMNVANQHMHFINVNKQSESALKEEFLVMNQYN